MLFRAKLEEGIIDMERRVVLEEGRLQTTGPALDSSCLLQRLLHSTAWEERFPIGLMETITGCSPETIRGFYERMYRPELVSVVVIGDIASMDGVESMIAEVFGAPSQPERPLPERWSIEEMWLGASLAKWQAPQTKSAAECEFDSVEAFADKCAAGCECNHPLSPTQRCPLTQTVAANSAPRHALPPLATIH